MVRISLRQARDSRGIGCTAEGGPNFAGTKYLYPGNNSIRPIKLSGSYVGDAEAANAAAGLQELRLATFGTMWTTLTRSQGRERFNSWSRRHIWQRTPIAEEWHNTCNTSERVTADDRF